MGYPKKIKDRAIQLSKEGYSAEKIVDMLHKEADWSSDYTLTSRTVRNWLKQAKEKQEEETPEQIELKRQHDRKIFMASDRIMNEKDLRSFPFPIRMPSMSMNETKEIWYEVSPFREQLSLDEAIKRMRRFTEFFNYESSKYFEPQLNILCDKLCNILGRIAFGIKEDFEAYKHISSQVSKPHPRRIREGAPQYQLHKRLAIRFESALRAYKNYRIAVKETLFL